MTKHHWSWILGVNDLATTQPLIAALWHPTRNGQLLPSDVQYGYKTKVWWLGRCGHEWDALPRNIALQASSGGCPVCCGKRVLIGFNDALSAAPGIVNIWDFDLNAKGPDEDTSGSGAPVAWKCGLGHQWIDSIAGQLKFGDDCAFCSGRKTCVGLNDLATTHVRIAGLWHWVRNGDLTPQAVTAGCNTKAWWLCHLGHEWKTMVGTITAADGGCPVCSGQTLLRGFNDMATTHVWLAKQWHPILNGDLGPEDVQAGHNRRVWWMCSLGHEWQSTPNSRSQSRQRTSIRLRPTKRLLPGSCPTCGGRTLLIGFNDFATLRPVEAREWHPTRNGDVLPSQVRQWSPDKYWWLGACGHEWDQSLMARSQGQGCPQCVSKTSSKVERSIHAALAIQKPSALSGVILPVPWGKAPYANVDIFIPELNLVVEYDGSHWHRNKVSMDTAKTTALIAAGYTVVRIRHHPLPVLGISSTQYIEVSHRKQAPNRLVEQLLALLPA
jgi:hypothetical protein